MQVPAWVVLLSLCLLLVVLRGRMRERLEPTDKIKAPLGPGVNPNIEYPHYSEDDMLAIWGLMPESVRQAYSTTVGSSAQHMLSTEIADFYTRVYEPATSPITEQQITAWVGTGPVGMGRLQRADRFAALKAYFIDQAPPPPSPPPPPSESGDFTLPPSTPEPAEERRRYGAPVTVTVQVPQNATGVEMGTPTTEASPPPEATETPAS